MNYKKTLAPAAAIATAFLVSACAGPAQTTLADGSLAYRIQCESSVAGANYCFERAGKTCGAEGYTIVDQDGQVISRSDAADTSIEALIRKQAQDQSGILIKCGA